MQSFQALHCCASSELPTLPSRGTSIHLQTSPGGGSRVGVTRVLGGWWSVSRACRGPVGVGVRRACLAPTEAGTGEVTRGGCRGWLGSRPCGQSERAGEAAVPPPKSERNWRLANTCPRALPLASAAGSTGLVWTRGLTILGQSNYKGTWCRRNPDLSPTPKLGSTGWKTLI